MTETELWKIVIKHSETALETIGGAQPSRRDVKIVADRTMRLFMPESEHSEETAARSISSLLFYTFRASLLAIAGIVARKASFFLTKFCQPMKCIRRCCLNSRAAAALSADVTSSPVIENLE